MNSSTPLLRGLRSALRTAAVGTLLLLAAPLAQASGYLRLGGMYMSSSTDAGGATSSHDRLLIDIGAGYITEKGWTLGALYAIESQDADRSSFGPTVGWISRRENGPYILGTLFVNSEAGNSEGSGLQADFGYKFQIRKISFAPQFSYKRFTYGDGESEPEVTYSYIDPMFVMWVDF